MTEFKRMLDACIGCGAFRLLDVPLFPGGAPEYGVSICDACLERMKPVRTSRAHRGDTCEACGYLVADQGTCQCEPEPEPEQLRWRTGRKLGRTIYAQDVFLGMMDTVALAEQVVHEHNFHLDSERDQASAIPRGLD